MISIRFRVIMHVHQKNFLEAINMLESKLNLIGRDTESVLKEIQIVIMRLSRENLSPEERKHIAGDINGVINWFENEKEKLLK